MPISKNTYLEPLISVVVPVYKVEKYLQRCVDSILHQTYTNLEVILVDDGSPDSCGLICDDYKETDPRIVVIHKENGGLSDARNVGLAQSTGELIAFIDSDDWISPNYFEILYGNMTETHADISVCNFQPLSDENINISHAPNVIETLTNIEALEQYDDRLYVPIVTAWGKLMRKSLFSDIQFPKGKIHEDEFTTHKLLFYSEKVCYTDLKMYYYWQRDDSIMATRSLKSYLDNIEALNERALFFLHHGLEKLRHNTLLKAFNFTTEVYSNKALFADKENFNYFLSDYKLLVGTLLKSRSLSYKQRLKFTMHFHSPGMANWFYSLVHQLLSFMKGESLKRVKRSIAFRLGKNSLVKKYKKHHFNSRIQKKKSWIESINKRPIFLMATPCHGNIGDHAIVNAQYGFFADLDLDDCIIEITANEYHLYKDDITPYIDEDNLIIIDGGGNLGTLWTNEDDKISEIIKSYYNNKIVVFPQTCYYDDSEDADKRIEKNTTIYNSNKKLTIALRDKKSYDFFKQTFPLVDSMFVPDIVLYSNFSTKVLSREGVMLCFRKDKEKVVSDSSLNELKSFLTQSNLSYYETDTVISKDVYADNRNEELHLKLDEFSRSSLVITDRLHGMIFATITGTPCIAVDNISKKVSGVGTWVSDRESIHICDDVNKNKSNILDMYDKSVEYNNTDIKAALGLLTDKILN